MNLLGRQAVSEKKDWNTPPKYIKAIKKFFNQRIDLDPCSNKYSLVDAVVEYELPTDGLKESWFFNNIYLNPPYGRDMDRGTTIYNWINKATDSHIQYGSEVLMLIPVATNTKHFKDLIFKYGNSICFLEDTRLKFWSEGVEDKKGAPMSCCIVYMGKNNFKFRDIFSDFGKVFRI